MPYKFEDTGTRFSLLEELHQLLLKRYTADTNRLIAFYFDKSRPMKSYYLYGSEKNSTPRPDFVSLYRNETGYHCETGEYYKSLDDDGWGDRDLGMEWRKLENADFSTLEGALDRFCAETWQIATVIVFDENNIETCQDFFDRYLYTLDDSIKDTMMRKFMANLNF